MYRRVITLCLSGIALASAAYAANANYGTWGITSAVSPPGSATISPAPGQNGFSQYSNTPSVPYTITAGTGYSLKTVFVDGRTVNIQGSNPNYPGSFAYTYNNDRYLHTLKVITVPNKYDFTLNASSSDGSNATGLFSPAKVKQVTYATKNKTITIIPMKGSVITGVTDTGGAAPTYYIGNTGTQVQNWPSDLANGQSVKVVYASVDGAHTLSATFAKIRGATASILKSYPTAPLNMSSTNGSVSVTLDGRSSTTKSGSIAYTWSLASGPATGCSFSAATARQTSVTFTQAGTYVVSLVVNDGPVASAPATVSFTVNPLQVSKAGRCVNCHNQTLVSAYDASPHVSGNGPVCTDCHGDHGTTGITLGATYATSKCQTCHTDQKAVFEQSSHFAGTYGIAEGIGGPNGDGCVACHNPHATTASFFVMSTATQIKKSAGCESCHAPGSAYGVYNADGTGKAPHFPNTATSWDAAATAYYVVNGNSCADCHGHNNTINAGWAEGGHGDITAGPWKGDSGHTDWGAQGSNGVSYQSSPQATNCIRCHSAKGFATFVDSGFKKIDKLPASQLASPLTCSA